MKLSIIVPVYNEEKTLEKIVDKVQKVDFEDVKTELIIIDDCSRDNSWNVINSLSKKHKNIRIYKQKKNMGKGAAIRKGFENALGDIIVIQDADLEYNPEEFKKMLKIILNGKSKVVYGSRLLGKSKGFTIWSHYYGNKLLSLLTRILYGKKITDMETCYKMMTKEVAKKIKLVSNKFDIEPEITAKIIKMNYKILEIPINYEGRSFKEGKKISWKDGLKAIWVLIYWRLKA